MMESTTWRQLGSVWVITHFTMKGPPHSFHLVLNAGQAALLAQNIIQANKPRDEDVADVMEAG